MNLFAYCLKIAVRVFGTIGERSARSCSASIRSDFVDADIGNPLKPKHFLTVQRLKDERVQQVAVGTPFWNS